MKVTFLIGNGFDLNLGLKTRYTDFLNYYQSIRDDDPELVKAFKRDLADDLDTWADAERAFGAYTGTCTLKGLTGSDFCDLHDDFCDKLAVYLQEQEKLLTPYDLSGNFIESLTPEALLQSLRAVPRELIDHIILSQLKVSEWDMSFIVFNYTTIVDNMLENAAFGPRRSFHLVDYKMQLADIVHVHGTSTENMILGVNDESQIADVSIFSGEPPEWLKSVIKPQCNDMIESGVAKRAQSILFNSDLIYIYGMSLGETDKLWWQWICAHMEQHPNVHTLIHGYGIPERSVNIRKRLTLERELKQRILAYSKQPDIAAQIHIDPHNLFAGLNGIASRKVSA